YCQLAGTRTWNQIARAEQIQKSLARKPTSPADKFVLHDRYVSRGSAERRQAQPQKKRRQFAQRGSRRNDALPMPVRTTYTVAYCSVSHGHAADSRALL